MLSLLETIHAIFPPILSGQLAARMGESVNGMKRALQAAVPVMLSGIIGRGVANPEQALVLCRQAHRAGHNQWNGVTSTLVILGSKDASDSAMIYGSRLLATFGSAEHTIVAELSQYARIQPEAARDILALVGAVLLKAVAQYYADHQLSAEETAAMLVNLRSPVRNMLPSELAVLLELPAFQAEPNRIASLLLPASAVVQRALEHHVWARWYIVASVVVLFITGLGLATLGALQTVAVDQAPNQTESEQGTEAVSAMAEKVPAALRMLF